MTVDELLAEKLAAQLDKVFIDRIIEKLDVDRLALALNETLAEWVEQTDWGDVIDFDKIGKIITNKFTKALQ